MIYIHNLLARLFVVQLDSGLAFQVSGALGVHLPLLKLGLYATRLVNFLLHPCHLLFQFGKRAYAPSYSSTYESDDDESRNGKPLGLKNRLKCHIMVPMRIIGIIVAVLVIISLIGFLLIPLL